MTVPGLRPSGRLDPSSGDHPPLAPPFSPDQSSELAFRCQPADVQNSSTRDPIQHSIELSGNGRHATPRRQAQARPPRDCHGFAPRRILVAMTPGSSDARRDAGGRASAASLSVAVGALAGSVLRTRYNARPCHQAQLDEPGAAGLAMASTLVSRVRIKSGM